MGIKEAFAALVGKKQPRNAYNEREVKFYKEARTAREHGRVVVSHLTMGLDQCEVPFIFPGMSEPPKLDDRLLTDIRSAAESQGYIFHHLIPHRYGLLTGKHPEFSNAVMDAVEDLNRIGELTEESGKALVEAIGVQIQAHEMRVQAEKQATAPTFASAESIARTLAGVESTQETVGLPVGGRLEIGGAALKFPRMNGADTPAH